MLVTPLSWAQVLGELIVLQQVALFPSSSHDNPTTHREVPSLGWDIKPRPWPVAVIKGPIALSTRLTVLTSVSWLIAFCLPKFPLYFQLDKLICSSCFRWLCNCCCYWTYSCCTSSQGGPAPVADSTGEPNCIWPYWLPQGGCMRMAQLHPMFLTKGQDIDRECALQNRPMDATPAKDSSSYLVGCFS